MQPFNPLRLKTSIASHIRLMYRIELSFLFSVDLFDFFIFSPQPVKQDANSGNNPGLKFV